MAGLAEFVDQDRGKFLETERLRKEAKAVRKAGQEALAAKRQADALKEAAEAKAIARAEAVAEARRAAGLAPMSRPVATLPTLSVAAVAIPAPKIPVATPGPKVSLPPKVPSENLVKATAPPSAPAAPAVVAKPYVFESRAEAKARLQKEMDDLEADTPVVPIEWLHPDGSPVSPEDLAIFDGLDVDSPAADAGESEGEEEAVPKERPSDGSTDLEVAMPPFVPKGKFSTTPEPESEDEEEDGKKRKRPVPSKRSISNLIPGGYKGKTKECPEGAGAGPSKAAKVARPEKPTLTLAQEKAWKVILGTIPADIEFDEEEPPPRQLMDQLPSLRGQSFSPNLAMLSFAAVVDRCLESERSARNALVRAHKEKEAGYEARISDLEKAHHKFEARMGFVMKRVFEEVDDLNDRLHALDPETRPAFDSLLAEMRKEGVFSFVGDAPMGGGLKPPKSSVRAPGKAVGPDGGPAGASGSIPKAVRPK